MNTRIKSDGIMQASIGSDGVDTNFTPNPASDVSIASILDVMAEVAKTRLTDSPDQDAG